ncbi:hypothetical protein [Brachyspira hampsonii]|uniref:hypothetical protein n=1 Tax=Brachyspira hampsonii TaxID=1287055 RepID=UPI00159EFA6B|nr:hypothetical protein [Brachyspira hampsonii]
MDCNIFSYIKEIFFKIIKSKPKLENSNNIDGQNNNNGTIVNNQKVIQKDKK